MSVWPCSSHTVLPHGTFSIYLWRLAKYLAWRRWPGGERTQPPSVGEFMTYFQQSLFSKLGLPWSHGCKEPTCQCKRTRFDPPVRKIPWRRAWQPTPIFLLGEAHGQKSLAGYSSWRHKELDRTEMKLTGRKLAESNWGSPFSELSSSGLIPPSNLPASPLIGPHQYSKIVREQEKHPPSPAYRTSLCQHMSTLHTILY